MTTTTGRNPMPNSAKIFIAAVLAAGILVVGYSAMKWHPIDPLRLAGMILIAALASQLKLKIPGVKSTMSMNVPFILLSIFVLSHSGAVLIACTSTVVQCLWKRKTTNAVQVLFNVANMANAAMLAILVMGRVAPGYMLITAATV